MSKLAKESSSCNQASTSQEGLEEEALSLPPDKKIHVTLLSSEWKSLKGGLSTINRELAIQLAKHPNVDVTVYLPQCSEDDKKVAAHHNVKLIEAEELPGFEPIHWLSVLPQKHLMDCVVAHGVLLGRYAQLYKQHCKWIQVVHTAPEELGMYKTYADAISKGEKKHQAEVQLCEAADQVVAVGPKLKEAFARCLRPCQKDQAVLSITPSIFSEFSGVKQAAEERETFSVLVLGRGDSEDFELKGYDIVAKAIAELNEKSYHLLFVGAPSGKEDEVAEKLACHIDCSQLTVRSFNESREQLAKLFCEADLAVMPSRTEGFGLTALEALSAGLPILVSGNSGFGEALRKVPYGTHWIVDTEQPQDWAKAIKDVRKKDRKLRLKEVKFLRENYAEEFSWQDQCTSLVEMTQNIISGPTPDEQDSPVLTPGNLQENQGVEEGASKRLASRKGKRPLSHSGTCTSSPKKSKEETVGLQDHSNVVKILQAEYKRRSLLKPLPWYNTIQLPIDVYTTLKIVSRRKADFRLESNVVNMSDLLESFDNGDDTMVLVEGNPGIGKTTFCLKFAYDWANQKNSNQFPTPKFELVLLLKCRDIDGNIMEAINEQLLPKDMEEKSRRDLMDYIKDLQHQENILIILDGLDELPQKSKEHVDELLDRRILPFCYVLATCRQERSIKVRMEFTFDILLQIEGFTENNAFEYIRKHFKIVSPKQSLNGENSEKLIQQIQNKPLVHALCSNPLNLLLLCVVFEDYEGELPSSRTKLYQIIIRCLLRRFLAKNNLTVPDKDDTLEKFFKESIFALGQLAWNCLLKDRHSFYEEELNNVEQATPGLLARYLGLVFKEAGLKRLTPLHEYHFLHKTFQEYLAATYLVHMLQTEEVNVFEKFSLDFYDVVMKYRQVFLFVCGILDEEASILYRQIGEELASNWDWLQCTEEEATFFFESFSESRNPEKMAVTLCKFLPFPQDIEIDSSYDCYPENFVLVLKACKSLSLQQPERLTVPDADALEDGEVDTIKDVLVSCLPIKTLCISGHEITQELAAALNEGLTANTTLSHLALDIYCSIPFDVADVIGKGLAASKTLTSVMFTLREEWREAWASAIEEGLSADTLLSTVILKLDGSLSDTAIQGLVKLSSNKSLSSLTLIILGEMQDSLGSAVSKGLTAAQNALKSFSLLVFGKLSCNGALSLEKGFLENNSLNSLLLHVYGDLPNNWTAVVQNVFLSKESVSYKFYPNPISELTEVQIQNFHPVVLDNRFISDHSLTLNVWGKLGCVEAKALGKVLRSSTLSRVTLNLHGKLADPVVDCFASYLKPHKTLASVTLNIWCELTENAKATLQGLSNNPQKPSFVPNFQNQAYIMESCCKSLDLSASDPSQLRPLFHEVKKSQTQKVALTIDNHGTTKEDWGSGLSAVLAENSTLTSLSLTINNFSDATEDRIHGLSDSLAETSSLTTLVLKINNFSDMSGKWGHSLGDALAKFASLTELSLTINDLSKMSEFRGNLANSLSKIKSLSVLRITINCTNKTTFWRGLGDCLKETESLTTLSLTINNYSDISGDWADGLDVGLAKNTSITTMNLEVNNYDNDMWGAWGHWLAGGLAGNTSLTTLSLKVSNYCEVDCEWAANGLADGLANNTSLTKLSLAISWTGGDWPHRLGDALIKNTSLTELTLNINVTNSEVCGQLLTVLCDRLSKSESLTTLRFIVNNQDQDVRNVSHSYVLINSLNECRSLTSLDVTVSLYGEAKCEQSCST